jgi:hypothetical protein
LKYTVGNCVCCAAEYSGPSPYPFCYRCFAGDCRRCRMRVRAKRFADRDFSPTGACERGGCHAAGVRWLAHQPRDAHTPYKMPEPAGSRTPGEQLGPTKEKRPPGRRMPCGWRCGSRLTASQMRAFRRLLQAAVGLKAKNYAPKGRGARWAGLRVCGESIGVFSESEVQLATEPLEVNTEG